MQANRLQPPGTDTGRCQLHVRYEDLPALQLPVPDAKAAACTKPESAAVRILHASCSAGQCCQAGVRTSCCSTMGSAASEDSASYWCCLRARPV